MNNSQLCFLIANLWLMMPVIGGDEHGVYMLIGIVFIALSLMTREWKRPKAPDITPQN